METFFIKGYIKNSYLGLTGQVEVIEHFSRPGQPIERLIYTIIKACKSIEDWTLEVRLPKLKSHFTYGLSERDIAKLNFNSQTELLQYYCNAYVLLYHLSKMTQDRLDTGYQEQLSLQEVEQEGGKVLEYIREADRKCLDKWNRSLF